MEGKRCGSVIWLVLVGKIYTLLLNVRENMSRLRQIECHKVQLNSGFSNG